MKWKWNKMKYKKVFVFYEKIYMYICILHICYLNKNRVANSRTALSKKRTVHSIYYIYVRIFG